MTLDKLIGLLVADLANEYTHMAFYLLHASVLTGPHRPEYSEIFRKQAESEMAHAREFQDLIVGLGGSPAAVVHPVPMFPDVVGALRHAVALEETVVDNYLRRMAEADELGGIDGMTVRLFLEDQFQDSRRDLDHFRQILAGV